MKKTGKLLCLIIALCFAFMASGCATIVSGRYQKIPVVSNPSGAKVFVNGAEYQSPCTLVLNRKKSYTIRVEKEGYVPVEIVLRYKGIRSGFKETNGWVWGNALFGVPIVAVIGVAIDMSTGAAYKFSPSKLNINLAQQKLGLNDPKGKDILIVGLVSG